MLAGVQGGALDQRHRLVDVERLGQVFEGAALVGGHRAFQVGMGGHDYHRQARIQLADARQQVETAGTRHADVGEDHARLLEAQAVEQAVGAVEALAGQTGLLQGLFQDPADRAVIVDDPDGFRSVHGVDAPCSSGRNSEKTVRPGWLSHSIRP
ncbi:hypothetical protein D9M73_234080 [compost metagenome]